MGERTVAGILIERRKAYLVIAELEGTGKGSWPDISITASESYTLDRNDKAQTFKQLKNVVEDTAMFEPAVVCVGAFGPFVSLKPEKLDETGPLPRRGTPKFEKSLANRYGRIDPDKGNEPLRGEPLFAHFREWLDDCGLGKTRVYIDTDANACALGEAFLRDFEDGQLLVYLLVTEGVGAGLVNGRRIIQSALHPEIGLLPVRYHRDEPLMKPNEFAGDLGLLASTTSIAQRFGNPLKTLADVESLAVSPDRKIWSLQAYYLAQACIACTVILAPHKIVVATDADPDGRLVERIRHFAGHFRRLQQEFSPAFSYAELEERDFIDSPREIELGERAPEFGPFYTGAIGMAVKAAMQFRPPGVTKLHSAR